MLRSFLSWRKTPAFLYTLGAILNAASPSSTAPHSTGTISGTVLFKGPAPVRAKISMAADAFCAKQGGLSEEIVVNGGGKLAGVHVGLKNGKAGTHPPPREPVVVAQKACMYTPRVSGVMAGQQINITNGDAVVHNVHAYLGHETWFNRGQMPGGPAIQSNAGQAGSILELKCDIHSWMRAYAVVSDHPFFDVTEKSGAFAIQNVPTGRYTLEAWHPVLGKKRKRVHVKAGQESRVEFHFSQQAQ